MDNLGILSGILAAQNCKKQEGLNGDAETPGQGDKTLGRKGKEAENAGRKRYLDTGNIVWKDLSKPTSFLPQRAQRSQRLWFKKMQEIVNL